uniref:Delta-9 desaturase 3 n=1 Tax=Lysiphlebus testaceipes TaxID=77504 RepID=Q4PP77_LYSTE|nr:delta-9 desaturase 3 [Lysiphlebus testaceipes]
MGPNITSTPTGVLFENELEINPQTQLTSETKNKEVFVRKIVWRNVAAFIILHLAALFGLYRVITSAKILTTLFAYVLYVCGGLGITAGAHRLWSHKSYKAKLPLRLILMVFNLLAFQNSIWEWSRDHRVHHKYSETDADPHNAKRGFFFSHVGWLMSKKHPDVKEKGRGLDMKDLEADPVVAFQKKYYFYLMPLVAFVLPTAIPMYFWNETYWNAMFVSTLLRYTITLNMTWLVNSAAHFFGPRPYDKNINPSENIGVAIGAFGEGWHNYHHVFPWDYKAAELGDYGFNWTTGFIDFFAKIGWAYDLKVVEKGMIQNRVKRTGDGSHEVWGWGDKDQTVEDRNATIIHNPKDQ